MIGVYLLLIFLSCFLLVKASDMVVLNLKGLAEKTRLGVFAISGLIAALGTSLPEIFVGLASAFEGSSSLALGTVIGSNIANLSFIIGGAALLGGPLWVRGKLWKRDIFYALLAGISPLILLIDGDLSRLDGLILLSIYAFYQLSIFREKPRIFSPAEGGFVHRLIRRINHLTTRRELGWVFLGFALLIFSSEILVRAVTKLAFLLKLPVLVLGLILIALGTSLPELVFSYEAIKKDQPQMALGNLLGSIVANATFITGWVVLVSPIKIQIFDEYLLATISFLIAFGVFYFFIRTKNRLERWEGAFLVGFYLAFVLSEFFHP